MNRPRFPWRTLLLNVVAVVVAGVGVLQWFVTDVSVLTKIGVVGVLAFATFAVTLAPYLRRLVIYLKRAVAAFEGLPKQVRDVRAQTWLAVETNALLDGVMIRLQRFKLDGSDVLFLIDAGCDAGVRTDMEFEIAAVPDMEVYGVGRVADVNEASSWCVLQPDEARSEFTQQMRERLQGGEVHPPPGYEVRPFMAETYRYVAGSMVSRPDAIDYQGFVPLENTEVQE